MNARIVLQNAAQRRDLLESIDIDRNELVVETVDRYAPDHAVLMHPTCPDAFVIAKQVPEVEEHRQRAYTTLRHLYITRNEQAVKILMSQSGATDVSPSRCYVVRRGA